jgi:hypothetical protein
VGEGLRSSTWWEEAKYKQLGTVNDRALFILDKLINPHFRFERRPDQTIIA